MSKNLCESCEGTGYAVNCTPRDRERGDLWACGHCAGDGSYEAEDALDALKICGCGAEMDEHGCPHGH